jgi:hypothetical protein
MPSSRRPVAHPIMIPSWRAFSFAEKIAGNQIAARTLYPVVRRLVMNKTYLISGAAIVLVVAVVASIFVMRSCGAPSEDAAPAVVEIPTPVPAPTPTLEERLSERLSGTTLATSDRIVAELVAELSSRPELAAWLVNEDLVRRFTAAVDNIADGVNPRTHVDFLKPEAAFQVDERRGRFTIDESSYQRYNTVAVVCSSLDTEGTVVLYRELRPLVDEAYREIAPPNADFDDRLVAAIDHLLATPVPPGKVEVERKVVTYTYADRRFEGLSSAQRQLLRTGPDNMRAIQGKLRELKAALAAAPRS